MSTLHPTLPAEPWPAETVALTVGRRPRLEISVRSTPAGAPGDGREPAVMVHGLGGSALDWTDLMALLADRLDVRAPDLPGFGLSPAPPDRDYTLGAHARTVAALIDADGRGPVHLFGNSMGGAVAVMIAAYRPDLVRTLTLVSPALPDLRPGRYRNRVVLLAAPGIGPRLSRYLAGLTPEQRLAGMLELVYADPTALDPKQREVALAEVERRAGLEYSGEALAESARALMQEYLRTGRSSLWRLASRVSAPTLLLYGRKDRLVSHLVAPKAKAAFPDATVVVLPQTGHVAQLEHPELVDRFVRRLLDRG